jgi:hypothetical protein
MNGKNFEKLVDDFTKEVEEGLYNKKQELIESQEEWEETIRGSQLSVELLTRLQYDHVIGIRLKRFRRFLEIRDCPDFVLAREHQLCTQTFEDVVANSTWSNRIRELKEVYYKIT